MQSICRVSWGGSRHPASFYILCRAVCRFHCTICDKLCWSIVVYSIYVVSHIYSFKSLYLCAQTCMPYSVRIFANVWLFLILVLLLVCVAHCFRGARLMRPSLAETSRICILLRKLVKWFFLLFHKQLVRNERILAEIFSKEIIAQHTIFR